MSYYFVLLYGYFLSIFIIFIIIFFVSHLILILFILFFFLILSSSLYTFINPFYSPSFVFLPWSVEKMSYLYHVYSITFHKPDRSIGEPVVSHEGLLLAPAYISPTSGQVYLLQYHGSKETNPNTVMPAVRIPGVFGNCPVDIAQDSLYKSITFPISHIQLIGVSHDLYAFCRTAKTIAKYNVGTTAEARQNWMSDTMASVKNQGIYKTLETYHNELKEEEMRKFKRRLAGINRRVCSSSIKQPLPPAAKV